VPTCGLDERLEDVRQRVEAAGWDACVVVNQEHIVLGLLRSGELRRESESVAERAMRPGPSTFRPFLPIDETAAHMVEHDLENSPVTTADGRLVGLVRRADAVKAAHELHDHGHG